LKHQQGSEREEDDKDAAREVNFNYRSTSYLIEKSTTKAIAFVDNEIDYMLQRQIIKALDKQIEIECIVCAKCVNRSFHYISWMIISVIVTNNRTVPLQRYQNSHAYC
jgi:hypothetical protein